VNYNDQRKQSREIDFLNRSLLENSKSRICYLDLRVKYFDEEIKARDLARLEAERLDSVEEGDIMEKNNDLQKIVANSTSSTAPVKLTPEERAKQKALLQKQKEKEKARLAKEKEKQKEKERLAREKQKEKERLAREKEKQKEKERLAKEREKQKEKKDLLREKEKQKEKERLAKERAKQKELEKKEREKQKALEKKEASSLNNNAKSISFETDNVFEPVINVEPQVEDTIVTDEVIEEIQEEDVVITDDVTDTTYEEDNEIEQEDDTVIEEVETEQEVEEVVEQSSPKSLEDLLAMKKKDDSKQTNIPSDNISKLRQRMEANRKLEQGIVDNNAKKAQAIEETKNKLKAMSRYEEFDENKDDDLYQQIEELERRIAELEEENNNLTDELNDLENEKESILKEQDKKIEAIHLSYVDEISDLRNEIDNLENDLSKKDQSVDNGEIEKLKAIISEQDQTIEKLKLQNAKLEEKLTKAEDEIEDLESQISDLEDELDELENASSDNESSEDNESLLKEIAELKAVVDKLDKLVDDKDEELANKEELIESLNEALNAEKENNGVLVNKLDKSDSEAVANLENKVAELEKNNEKLASENTELTNKITELEVKVSELEKANEELASKNAQINEKVSQANKKLTAAKSKVKTLEKDNKEKQEEIVILTNSLLEKENDEELKKQCEDLEKQIADKELVIEELTKSNEELKKLVSNSLVQDEVVSEETVIEISEEELLNKISELKKQIEEKDDKLSELNSRFDELSEKDIRNPEFTRAIMNIRERKQELVNKMASDKEAFELQQSKNKELLDEAYRKYYVVKEKRDELNKQYQNVGDSTSLRREEYLAKSQKITIEEETIVRCINDHKADEELAGEKFNNAINESEKMIKELNRQEVEIIEFYLNKLREEYSDSENYKEYEEQKKDLMKQLNELNIIHLQMQVALEQSRSLVRDSKVDNDIVIEDNIDSSILILKADVAHLTKEYNSLINKINMIKEHLDNRAKSEKILRITDEDIVKYNSVITDLDSLTVRFQTNIEVIAILKQDLSILSEETDQEQIDTLNSKLEYVEIVQNDIQEKINYCKEMKESLEENDKVNYYISLLKSMEQLKVKNIEFRVRANDIKSTLDNKLAELEALENQDESVEQNEN